MKLKIQYIHILVRNKFKDRITNCGTCIFMQDNSNDTFYCASKERYYLNTTKYQGTCDEFIRHVQERLL